MIKKGFVRGNKKFTRIVWSDFHYETYKGISPYRTLVVAWTPMYDIMCGVIDENI